MGHDTVHSVQFAKHMKPTRQTKWRKVLSWLLRVAVVIMSTCSAASGPASCKYQTMFAVRMASLPVIVEFLSLSSRHHDVQLLRYLTSFPGSVVPNLQTAIESGNLLYVLWSPLTDKVYGGRTTSLIERHRQHFCRISDRFVQGQIPAYEVMRVTSPDGVCPDASYFMLPVVQVCGGIPEAIAAERVFLNGYVFKLNMPHVRNCLRVSGVPVPEYAECTVNMRKQSSFKHPSSNKPLPRRRCPARVRKPLSLPKQRMQCSSFQKICIAMQFRGKDKISTKHGLRLLYVVRNPELLLAVVRFVMGNVIGKRRKLALKHIRRRCKQLKLQIPLGHCPVRIPWCLHEGNISCTKSILKEFCAPPVLE